MSNRFRSVLASLLVCTTGVTPGCGTILMMGGDQPVNVTTTPDGARIVVNGVTTDKMSPGTIMLDPKEDHSVQAQLGDMKAQAAVKKKIRIWIVVIDGFLTAGIGVFVDYMTGALYQFDPPRVHLNLGHQPVPVVQTPPPTGNPPTGNPPTGNPPGTTTTNLLDTPCPYCGEPRGNKHPCPHCGMD